MSSHKVVERNIGESDFDWLTYCYDRMITTNWMELPGAEVFITPQKMVIKSK